MVNKLSFLILWRLFIKLDTRYCVLLCCYHASHVPLLRLGDDLRHLPCDGTTFSNLRACPSEGKEEEEPTAVPPDVS